jgi:hypothetical protein
MTPYQFVCRCIAGNDGCDCIPSVFSDVPCQSGLVCTSNKCRPSSTSIADSTNAELKTSIDASGNIVVVDGDAVSVDAPASLETWKIAAIAAGGGLCIVITLVIIVIVVKRKRATKSGYDWSANQRGRAATYASILGDGVALPAPQTPMAQVAVANVQLIGDTPYYDYQQHANQQASPELPTINLPPPLVPPQAQIQLQVPPPPSNARPLPLPTWPEAPPTLSRPLPPSPMPLAPLPIPIAPDSPHQHQGYQQGYQQQQHHQQHQHHQHQQHQQQGYQLPRPLPPVAFV